MRSIAVDALPRKRTALAADSRRAAAAPIISATFGEGLRSAPTKTT